MPRTVPAAAEGVRAVFGTDMGDAAMGVTLVSTDGDSGRYARTVGAMCSVSAASPILQDAAAPFDCRLTEIVDADEHQLFPGAVSRRTDVRCGSSTSTSPR